MWKGDPVIQIEKSINLFLSEEAPNGALNPNNWTAEWDGQIRAPVTGDYVFTCEADDGCIVELNGMVIIQDNLSTEPEKDLLKPFKTVMTQEIAAGEWKNFIAVRGSKDPPRFPRTPVSESMTLEGGVFNHIKVKTMHTVHNSLYETGNAFIYLFWESSIIKKQVIPAAYFYTKEVTPAVAPMDYDPLLYKLDALMDND